MVVGGSGGSGGGGVGVGVRAACACLALAIVAAFAVSGSVALGLLGALSGCLALASMLFHAVHALAMLVGTAALVAAAKFRLHPRPSLV